MDPFSFIIGTLTGLGIGFTVETSDAGQPSAVVVHGCKIIIQEIEEHRKKGLAIEPVQLAVYLRQVMADHKRRAKLTKGLGLPLIFSKEVLAKERFRCSYSVLKAEWEWKNGNTRLP